MFFTFGACSGAAGCPALVSLYLTVLLPRLIPARGLYSSLQLLLLLCVLLLHLLRLLLVLLLDLLRPRFIGILFGQLLVLLLLLLLELLVLLVLIRNQLLLLLLVFLVQFRVPGVWRSGEWMRRKVLRMNCIIELCII